MQAAYQEIASKEKLTEVLQYLHRVGEYKALASKTIINNVYTFMRGKTLDFTRARSVLDREKIYHQMPLAGEKVTADLSRGLLCRDGKMLLFFAGG